MITLDYAIETVLQLPPVQQEMLVEILYKRRIEARRAEIARDAQTSIAEFRAGKLRPQTLEDILAELHDALAKDDEDE